MSRPKFNRWKYVLCLFIGCKEVLTEVIPMRAGVGGHLGSWFYSSGYCTRCGTEWDWRAAKYHYLLRTRGQQVADEWMNSGAEW
jgi:hypothetical protein